MRHVCCVQSKRPSEAPLELCELIGLTFDFPPDGIHMLKSDECPAEAGP